MKNNTTTLLQQIAEQLVTPGKGILAADESEKTICGRFGKRGIPCTEDTRRAYRELLFCARGIGQGISGVILHDETIQQTERTGILFPDLLHARQILTGIKVDKGTVPLPNFPEEKITEGLDGLAARLLEYRGMGAVFTKWRGVFTVGKELPSLPCIEGNAYLFAEFAAASQEAGLVPIVEPEVLLLGAHDMKACEYATGRVLQMVFSSLKKYRVNLSEMLLKTSMVLPGDTSGEKSAPELVALSTIRVLKAVVPKEVAGIVFLSGGQTPEGATANLNAIIRLGVKEKAPWPLSFSFSRALQDPVIDAWAGKEENIAKAQKIFGGRVAETARACGGKL